MSRTLNSVVATHLLRHRKITNKDAFLLYGITRLSSVIYELRAKGYPIEMTLKEGTNRYGNTVKYGVYTLPKGWKKSDLEKDK